MVFRKFTLVVSMVFLLSRMKSVALDSTTLGIVNLEAEYTNHTYQKCNFSESCSFRNLSCRFLHHLKDHLSQPFYYKDKDSAVDAVKHGYVSASIYFSDNFTDTYIARLILGIDADEETLDQSKIHVCLGSLNGSSTDVLKQDIQTSYQRFGEDLFKACDSYERIKLFPLSFEIVNRSQPACK